MDDKNTMSIEEIKSLILNDINFGDEDIEPKKPLLNDIVNTLQAESNKNAIPPQKPISKNALVSGSKNNNVALSNGTGLSNYHQERVTRGLDEKQAIAKGDAIINDILNEENKQLLKNENNKKPNQERVDTTSPKDKRFKNSYIYGFIFIIGSILLEITNFVRLGLGFLPICFGIEFSIILILAGIIFLVPTEVIKILLMSIFLGVQLVMNIINASLYKVLYELVTVDKIFNLNGEIADAFEWSMVDFWSVGFSLLAVVIIIVLIIFGKKYMPRFKMRKSKTAIASLLILVFSIEILSFSSLKLFEVGYFANAETTEYIDSSEFLYKNTTASKFASLKRFGFWGFYLNNLNNILWKKSSLSKEQMSELSSYLKTGEDYLYSNSNYNGVNISGSLSNDNLIVIVLESIEWFAVDPVNTPHLYEFLEDYCVQFTNFYGNNKTNVSEQISLLGNSPYVESFNTLNNTVGIDVPNSLPNLFKDKGYDSVNYFYGYKGTFHQRDIINKKFGFSNVYTMEQCPIANKSEYFGDFLDDGDFINAYKELFMPNNKKFFSFFTTISSHGPYEKSNNRYEEYYTRFENNYQNYCNYVINNNFGWVLPEKGTADYFALKEYKSKAMALDNAINVILSYLKTTRDVSTNLPLYDNTTIVMFADHNCYYSDLGYKIKNVKKYANSKDIYNIPFAIFNKSLSAGKVNYFCNTFDIYPTICDLYGLSYNKNLTQGYSAFSEQIESSLFVSAMAGIFDKDYFTVTLDDYTPQNNSLDTNAKLKSFKQKVNNYFKRQEQIENYYIVNYAKNY